MVAKYIRTSTLEQNTARQETNSYQFGKVYIDQCSGSTQLIERKEGKKLMKDIAAGLINEIHVSSICRLGRSIIDVLTTIEHFNKNSVNLYVENIGMFSMIKDKPNPSFNMIICVLSNVADLERKNMLERQREGIEIAKAQGVYKGRLYGSVMSDEDFMKKYKTVSKELKNGQSLRRAAALGGCSLGTAQKVQRLLELEQV